MKIYKIIINTPNKQNTELTIDEEMLKRLEPVLNSKKIIQVHGDYINTAYIVMITLDIEATSRENRRIQDEEEAKRIAEKTESSIHKEGRERMKKMREDFYRKIRRETEQCI